MDQLQRAQSLQVSSCSSQVRKTEQIAKNRTGLERVGKHTKDLKTFSSTAASRKQHSAVISVLGNSQNIHVKVLNKGGLLRLTVVQTTAASTSGFVPVWRFFTVKVIPTYNLVKT